MPDKEIMLQIREREESRPWAALDAGMCGGNIPHADCFRDALTALAEDWRATAELYERAKLKGAQTAHVIPLRHAAQQLDKVIDALNQPRRAALGELQPHGATVNAGLDEPVHRFQVGLSGTTCTAMVERGGASEDCGRYASHPAHRLQSGPAPEETIASLDALIAESTAAAAAPSALIEATRGEVAAIHAANPIARIAESLPGRMDDARREERRAAERAGFGVERGPGGENLAPPTDFPGQASAEEVTAYLRGDVDDIPGPPLAPNGITDMTARPWRVLVTGSRTWDDAAQIHRVLEGCRTTHPHGTSMVVVHGACPSGADAIAAAWCKANDVATEEYPADWSGPAGKGAGLARNQAMVDSKPNECVAFIRDESKGASHCAALAERADIPTTRFTSPSSDPWESEAEAIERLRKTLGDAPPPAVYRTAREILESNPVTMPSTPSIPPVPLLGQPGNGGPAYDHGYIPPGGVPATYAELLTPVPRAALPAHISHSQIGTAGECGVKYRLQRLPRDERVDQRLAPVEQIPQWANIGGNAFHAVVEDVERGVSATSPDVLAAAPPETLWEQHFGAEIAKIEGTSPVPRSRWRAARKGAEGEAWWWSNGPLMIERYLKARPSELTAMLGAPWDRPAEVAIELERTVPVDTPYGPIDYRAIIDRVTVRTDPAGATTLVIRDYKSGYQMPDSTQQLGEYAQVLRLLGVPAQVKITGTYFNARKGEWTPEADLEGDGWSAEWFRYHVATGHAERLKLTSGPTPARPSSFCGGCPVRWACPLKNGAKS